jgi:hypothetical protein
VLLESNIDDMNPELYGNLMDVLYKIGALDGSSRHPEEEEPPATRLSCSRTGTTRTCATHHHARDHHVGVRVSYPERYETEREIHEVQTRWAGEGQTPTLGRDTVNFTGVTNPVGSSFAVGVPLKECTPCARRRPQGADDNGEASDAGTGMFQRSFSLMATSN